MEEKKGKILVDYLLELTEHCFDRQGDSIKQAGVIIRREDEVVVLTFISSGIINKEYKFELARKNEVVVIVPSKDHEHFVIGKVTEELKSIQDVQWGYKNNEIVLFDEVIFKNETKEAARRLFIDINKEFYESAYWLEELQENK